MTRPLVGVTGPERGGSAAWWFTWLALFVQGGRAVRITHKKQPDFEKLDGLIIGGGADIDPEHYGMETGLQEVKEAAGKTGGREWLKWIIYPFIYFIRRLFSRKRDTPYDTERDELEMKLLESAVARKIPVMGICRGAQLINVSRGGSLHNEILEFYEESPVPRSIFPVKEVSIEEDTLLMRILQVSNCMVNAWHHQAIKDLGVGIQISARESNEIIQAIECENERFMLGVQWHPEYLPLDKVQRRLFSSLVNAAAERLGEDINK